MSKATTTASFFEAMYQANSDPWNFGTSEYETRRYDATVQALGDRRFARAFEPGCSVGVLTERLTRLCTAVEAIDISQTAVREAKKRCAGVNATIRTGSLPHDIPAGEFDLIIFSEIGYYFEERVLRDILKQLIQKLTSKGTLIAVHWTGQSSDHILAGHRVHEIIHLQSGLAIKLSQEHDGFILECWERA